jgi:hypothetical protein
VRFFGHNIGFKCADAWQFYLQDTWADGAGAQQNNIGYYLDYAGAGSDPNYNNVVLATNANAQNVAQYGWRIENGTGSIFVSCQALQGIYGWYIGDPPSAIPLKFMFFVGCQADTQTTTGFLLSKGSASSTGNISFTETWAGVITVTGNRNISLVNMTDVKFTGVITESSSYSVVLDGCTSCKLVGGTIADYDAFNTGTQGIYCTNSNNNIFTGLDVSPATAAVSPGTAFYETGTSNYNLVTACQLKNGHSLVGANTKVKGVSGTSGALVDFDRTLGNYANDAAAQAAGIPIGGEYRNGSAKMVRVA